MAYVKVAVVHNMAGEIVAVSHSTASIDGMNLEGIAITGPDESVITTEVEEDNIADLHRTHVVMGQELRARDA